MRRICPALALTLLLPGLAIAQDRGAFRLQALWVEPTGEYKDPDVVIEADDAYGFRLAWELLWTERLGFELAAATSDHDLLARSEGVQLTVADSRVTPLTAALNMHLTPESAFDLFFGIGAAYVLYDDVTVRIPGEPDEKASLDDEFAWMAQLGFDVPLGDSFGLAFAIQYIDTEADVQEPGSPTAIPIDPWIAAAGVLFRF